MSCQVNIAPADEDRPFRFTYRPCGKPAAVDIVAATGLVAACVACAREEEKRGGTVDWPAEVCS